MVKSNRIGHFMGTKSASPNLTHCKQISCDKGVENKGFESPISMGNIFMPKKQSDSQISFRGARYVGLDWSPVNLIIGMYF